jgi:hypothetical protein
MNKWVLKYSIVGVLLFFVLLFMTLIRQDVPFWDEAYYLENVDILNDLGFTKEFLINYKGPAGPTYALIHFVFQPFTHLKAPIVRLVNIVFLAGTIFLIWKILKKLNKTNKNNFSFAISAMSIPTIYTISGLALTEMFAIFFLLIFIYFLVLVYTEMKYNCAFGIIAGISLSLAILGRQPLLMVLFALPVFFIEIKNGMLRLLLPSKRFLSFIAIAFVTSLLFPVYIFGLWGNIQPVSQAVTGVGVQPVHLMLALGYSATYVFFINPSFFYMRDNSFNKYEFILVGLISALLNIFVLKVRFTPFASIVSHFLSNDSTVFYSVFCGFLLTFNGLIFFYFFVKKHIMNFDQLGLFFGLGFMLVVATSIKVTHQFSARYIVQAFPLILLSLNYRRNDINLFNLIMLIFGGIIGMLSLDSYFIE